jgi:hypothetical protein
VETTFVWVTQVFCAGTVITAIHRFAHTDTCLAGVICSTQAGIVTQIPGHRFIFASLFRVTGVNRAWIVVIAINFTTAGALPVAAGIDRGASIAVVTGGISQILVGTAGIGLAPIGCTRIVVNAIHYRATST